VAQPSSRLDDRRVQDIRLVTPLSGFPLRVRLQRPLDDDELFGFCSANRELRIVRSADGELLIMPPSGGRTGIRNLSLSAQFGVWVEQDGSGVGFDSSTGFVLPNGAERSPDAAWVSSERWEALTDEQKERFVPLCPDFVVELRSRTDDVSELCDKMSEYISCGARLGWLIDPKDRVVYVYRADGSVEQLRDAESISGDPVLPGFVLQLGRIW
jgi:Uma2 family endonuclease